MNKLTYFLFIFFYLRFHNKLINSYIASENLVVNYSSFASEYNNFVFILVFLAKCKKNEIIINKNN